VCDDATPQVCDDTTIIVHVTIPPIAPTANAGGPYSFCAATQPWFLDGSGSVNPDDGVSEPSLPGDFIQAYEWDLDNDGAFDDAGGATPDVTAFYTGTGERSFLARLRVTDNTAISFPSSGSPDLLDTDSARVFVIAATDPLCASCIDDLGVTEGTNELQLDWTDTSPAGGYNVYRSTSAGGPYAFVANTASATYLDTGLMNGVTYYYVVREVALNGDEFCQSNEASGTPVDPDSDGDGVNDDIDQCPDTPEGEVVNENGCSIAQLAPCDGDWKNHGKYVSAVAHAAEDFLAAGLITEEEKDAIVSAAAKSKCGKKK